MRQLGTHALVVCVLGLCVLGVLGVLGCGRKKSTGPQPPSPEVTGLAAVPATAQVLIAADVAKLASSPIVGRAIDQLLFRESYLAESWAHVQESCKLDLATQLKHVMLALGPHAAGQPVGTGPVLMVATGSLSEPDLASCIRTMVGKGGGALTANTVAGRTVYMVKDKNRVMYFAFGRADTVVLGTDEAWVIDALGSGKKALDNPDIKTWLGMVDQRAPLWAIGRVDPQVGRGLASASKGKLTSPPTAFIATADLTSGAKLFLGVVMKDAASAKESESFVNRELGALGIVAQLKSLGASFNKIQVSANQAVLQFKVDLAMDEVNQLLSVLDEKPRPEQVTPPPTAVGSGSQ